MMHDTFIPFHRPSIGEEEIQEVAQVLRSGWLTTGARTAQFEKEFSDYTASRHALAVNSCTAGLHLALAALQIGPGDEVITTPLTFCATVNTILHVGATPVLADVGEDGNIDPGSVEARITERTRAIVPVHLAGLPCDMDALWALARKYDLRVIEDAAHAIGSEYRGLRIGASGDRASDAVAFSFYATKNLTTGEGGMITTGDSDLANRMKVLCLHGITRDAWNRYAENGSWFYEVVENGFKYNLSDLQSAIGIHQLHRQEEFIRTRSAYAAVYDEAFARCSQLQLPARNAHSRHAWHLYMLRLRLGELTIDRAEFIRELHRSRIGTSVHFIPIPLHPYASRYPGLSSDKCPRALSMYQELISLPLYPAMTIDQVNYVARTVRAIAGRFRRHRFVARAGHR
jgi:dTDP-4-amino-4,6-dideoxygalactose transaminase